ncbi:heme exporter protein CcmD [Halochromatium roseum]|uniref:heme exporter protein CcmD n=1 Tax=Halochromatium roseum TaxID=391920 RepID=UPI001913EE58|nr:heme exporter protein CcmD [Halochromatium roseum]MBK5939908.1 heme exporter protein CcmD [Halochromatium roseum]
MMEFFSQGGYAGYVWGAFGMTFGLLLIEVLQLRSSRKTTLTRISRLLRLRAPRQAGAGPSMQRGTSGPTT